MDPAQYIIHTIVTAAVGEALTGHAYLPWLETAHWEEDVSIDTR